MRGEVHHGAHGVAAQYLEHLLAVSHLAHDEGGVEHRLAEARRQVIQHDDPLTACAQLQDHVAADVAGAARNQYRGPIHVCPMCARIP